MLMTRTCATLRCERSRKQCRELPYCYKTTFRRQRTSLGQREGDVNSAGFRFQILAAASSDGDILTAIHSVGNRSRIAGKWQCRLPQQFACGLVEGAKFADMIRCPDEQQPARRDYWPAVILGASV